nr:Trans-aconitate 2-methyltransferase [Klebsiella pneumoniae]
MQMPDNWQESSHTLMRQVASEMGLPDRGRQPLLPPAARYDLLSRQGCEVDIWRTTYFHPLLLIRRLSTGCRAPGYALSGRPGRAGRKRVSHTLSRIAGRTLSVTVYREGAPAFPRLFIVARKIAA